MQTGNATGKAVGGIEKHRIRLLPMPTRDGAWGIGALDSGPQVDIGDADIEALALAPRGPEAADDDTLRLLEGAQANPARLPELTETVPLGAGVGEDAGPRAPDTSGLGPNWSQARTSAWVGSCA